MLLLVVVDSALAYSSHQHQQSTAESRSNYIATVKGRLRKKEEEEETRAGLTETVSECAERKTRVVIVLLMMMMMQTEPVGQVTKHTFTSAHLLTETKDEERRKADEETVQK